MRTAYVVEPQTIVYISDSPVLRTMKISRPIIRRQIVNDGHQQIIMEHDMI